MHRKDDYKLFGVIPFGVVFYGGYALIILAVLGISALFSSPKPPSSDATTKTNSTQNSDCNYEGCEEYKIEDAQYEEWKLEQQGAYDNTANRCVIKGNVSYSTGEKIYHLPNDPDYASTTIDPNYGEKWFCSEKEAQLAGWRHAAN